ncbi:hypothetical protein Bbelb_010260 [Branchiostoma belcheri]|nr:hypothetical protein Bbelb_010260 [Branchiostoma belcheri]
MTSGTRKAPATEVKGRAPNGGQFLREQSDVSPAKQGNPIPKAPMTRTHLPDDDSEESPETVCAHQEQIDRMIDERKLPSPQAGPHGGGNLCAARAARVPRHNSRLQISPTRRDHKYR